MRLAKTLYQGLDTTSYGIFTYYDFYKDSLIKALMLDNYYIEDNKIYIPDDFSSFEIDDFTEITTELDIDMEQTISDIIKIIISYFSNKPIPKENIEVINEIDEYKDPNLIIRKNEIITIENDKLMEFTKSLMLLLEKGMSDYNSIFNKSDKDDRIESFIEDITSVTIYDELTDISNDVAQLLKDIMKLDKSGAARPAEFSDDIVISYSPFKKDIEIKFIFTPLLTVTNPEVIDKAEEILIKNKDSLRYIGNPSKGKLNGILRSIKNELDKIDITITFLPRFFIEVYKDNKKIYKIKMVNEKVSDALNTYTEVSNIEIIV